VVFATSSLLYLAADYHYQKSAISDHIPVFLQNWDAPNAAALRYRFSKTYVR
jgi:hypothetical protein